MNETASNRNGETPIESWKEIGAYLQRDTTTARRWEKEEGLPVHRHNHKARSSVYAYPSEIDAWRASRKVIAEPPPPVPLWRSLFAPPRALAFGVMMLACLIMVGNGIRPVSAQQPRQTVQQVWTGAGVDTSGRPSPDGRYLSYINSTSGGDDKLALHDLVTGENHELTHGGGDADGPLFTPDGKEIVFAWYAGGNSPSLKMIGIDGSHERTVVKQYIFPKAVSPDGSLAIGDAGDNSNHRLVLVNLHSGIVTVLKSLGWPRPGIGNFSPDGRYVVYSLRVAQESPESEIYVLAVDGSSETKLVSPPGANANPLFAPDGSRVVFTSDREGRSNLYSIRVSDGKPQGSPELIKADFGGRSMGFTRDGSLYFAQTTDREDAYTAEIDPATWTTKGPAQRILDRKIEGGSAAPTWSPDGKWIAYLRARTINGPGDVTFVIRSTESTQEREVTAKVRQVRLARLFRWFPDSKALVFFDYGPQPVLQRLDLETGETRKLLSAGHFFAVSPDGRAILYPAAEKLAGKPGEPNPFLIRLKLHDLETGQERELTQFRNADGNAFSLSASPDGRYAAYFSPYTPDGNSVWIVPLAGGEQREALRLRGDRSFRPNSGIGWDPQGKGLVCTISEKNRNEIWYVPIEGGEPHKLGIDVADASFPNISPDGRRVAFMAHSSVSEVWTLKNLFAQAAK